MLFSGQRLNEIAKLTHDEVLDDHIAIPRDRNKSGETIITPLLPHLKAAPSIYRGQQSAVSRMYLGDLQVPHEHETRVLLFLFHGSYSF